MAVFKCLILVVACVAAVSGDGQADAAAYMTETMTVCGKENNVEDAGVIIKDMRSSRKADPKYSCLYLCYQKRMGMWDGAHPVVPEQMKKAAGEQNMADYEECYQKLDSGATECEKAGHSAQCGLDHNLF